MCKCGNDSLFRGRLAAETLRDPCVNYGSLDMLQEAVARYKQLFPIGISFSIYNKPIEFWWFKVILLKLHM